MLLNFRLTENAKSPSTRRAWIEIGHCCREYGIYVVALHPEGVDRNFFGSRRNIHQKVALHPEGVDRNTCLLTVLNKM